MDGYSVPKKLPFSRKFLSAKVVLSYIFDYVIIVVLIAGFYALDAVEPFHQQFSLRNYTLRYPYAVHERVPVPALLMICVIAPAAIIAVYTLVIDGIFSHQAGGRRKKYPLKKRLWELNCGVLGLLLAVGASFVITGALKNAIGKPRPDLIDRCKPNPEQAQLVLTVGNYSLVGHSICTQKDNAILKDGFRSFPSGHSSSAWAGLFYLSLYLGGKLHILDSRGEVWKTFIILIPSLGAALVAGSRIMDARHHPFDVLSGSLLGILVAWASYRQYFPSLNDFKAKGRAYPIRTWGRISGDYEPPIEDTYNDRMALRADVEPPKGGYAIGRTSSPVPTGNVFQDEIHASQRQRRQDSGIRGAPSSVYSHDRTHTDSPPPPMPPLNIAAYSSQLPSSNPFARTGNQRQFHRDDWEDSSEDEDTSDLELRPAYTLSQPSGSAHPDLPQHTFDTQETAYKPPPLRVGGVEGVGGPSTFPRAPQGDIGGSAGVPPQPPAHGVQLVESYAPQK